MPVPGANLPADMFPKRTLRDQLTLADEQLGGVQRMVEEANKSASGYWELQKLRARVEPKDVVHHADNSPEALLAAMEKIQKGEEPEYIDAEFQEVVEAPRSTLWSAKVVSTCV